MARDFKPKTDDQLEKTARTPEAFIFAQRLNALLASKNILQTELAEKTGITKQMIGGYMSGQKECGMNNLKRIATALDTTPDYLLGVTDTPSNTADVRTVCEITGLPPSTVEALTAFQSRLAKAGLTNPNPLDEFLTSNEFDTIFRGLETLSYPMQATAKGHSINAANLPTPVINAMLDGVCYQMSEALTKYLLNLKAKQTTQQINETDNQT